ncbi:MAG: hypothetical protein ACM3PY_04630 [Omnitrophica WOR_2 bacterium]
MVQNKLNRTMIVWWSYGQEHGGDDFRHNPPEVVEKHIRNKVERFCATPEEAWRWWQVDPNLIVERGEDVPGKTGPDTRIYYLLDHGISVIENIHLPPPDENYKWLIRICDFLYRPDLETWVMKDQFCDICVESDNCIYHLYDLPDLAEALDSQLVSAVETRDILRRMDWVVSRVARCQFPFPEIIKGQAACKELGW